MDSRYLSVAEVASMLSRSEKWVYQKKSEIPGYFKLAGSIFFDREVLVSGLTAAAARPAKNRKPEGRNDPHGLLS